MKRVRKHEDHGWTSGAKIERTKRAMRDVAECRVVAGETGRAVISHHEIRQEPSWCFCKTIVTVTTHPATVHARVDNRGCVNRDLPKPRGQFGVLIVSMLRYERMVHVNSNQLKSKERKSCCTSHRVCNHDRHAARLVERECNNKHTCATRMVYHPPKNTTRVHTKTMLPILSGAHVDGQYEKRVLLLTSAGGAGGFCPIAHVAAFGLDGDLSAITSNELRSPFRHGAVELSAKER